jgi:hypothetical protein
MRQNARRTVNPSIWSQETSEPQGGCPNRSSIQLGLFSLLKVPNPEDAAARVVTHIVMNGTIGQKGAVAPSFLSDFPRSKTPVDFR